MSGKQKFRMMHQGLNHKMQKDEGQYSRLLYYLVARWLVAIITDDQYMTLHQSLFL